MHEDTEVSKKEGGAKVTPLEFNAEDYTQYLGDNDLSDEQKAELLQTLWNIMNAFVDIGWGVDSVQWFLPELFEDAGKNTIREENRTQTCQKEGVQND